ncbi:MAG: PIN domain-containing protein [Cyanobacteria bacterium P01_G01_bin.54]
MSIKESFAWRLPLTEGDRQELWEKAFFVFDTNCLLDLYRESEESAKEFIRILNWLKEKKRLWIPYQVFLEFLTNREEDVVRGEQESFERTKIALGKWVKSQENSLKNSIQGRYLSKKITSLLEGKLIKLNDFVKMLVSEVEEEVDKIRNQYSISLDDDWILEEVLNTFNDCAGDPYSEKDLEAIYTEGKSRYASEVPPGFKDKDKEPEQKKYGDLVIWKQILDFSKEKGYSIIFVTRDGKEDWWHKRDGEKHGPRYELRMEFQKYTSRFFWMYSKKSFLDNMPEYLGIEVDEELIKETENDIKTERLQSEMEQGISNGQINGSYLHRKHETIRHTPVQSSHLSSVGYDFNRYILENKFIGGQVYQYYGVPEWEYLNLIAANTPGRYFEHRIKNGNYRYIQIG